LTADHFKTIEEAIPFEIGFPHDFIGSGVNPQYTTFLLNLGGILEPVKNPYL
jgi:hypothetical protein